MPRTFLAVRCPACGSGEAIPEGPRGFRCRHCDTLFMREAAQVAPRPVVVGRRRGGGGAAAIVASLAGVVLLGGFVAFFLSRGGDSPPDPPSSLPSGSSPSAAIPERTRPDITPAPEVAPPEPAPVPEPEVEPTPVPTPQPATEPIRIEAYQPLRGCTCKADLDGDGKAERIQLAVKASAVGTWITSAGTSREYAFDFIVRGDRGEPQRLPLAEATAPPRRMRGEWMALGLACEGDRMIFAVGSAASAYSLRAQSMEWTAKLPAPYTIKDKAPAAGGPSIDCAKLPLAKGLVDVRLPGGAMKLRAEDGREPG